MQRIINGYTHALNGRCLNNNGPLGPLQRSSNLTEVFTVLVGCSCAPETLQTSLVPSPPPQLSSLAVSTNNAVFVLQDDDSCGRGLGTRLTADTVVGVSSCTRKFTLAVAWGGVSVYWEDGLTESLNFAQKDQEVYKCEDQAIYRVWPGILLNV